MNDTYSFDQEYPPPQQQQQPAAPAQTDGRSATHGRVARMRDGSFAVWQEAPSGRGGRFVAMSAATASPQARETLDQIRGRRDVLDRLTPLAEEYITIGRNTPTGGWRQGSLARESAAAANPEGNWWNGLNFPRALYDNDERSRVEEMIGLQDEALRANILPGQGGTANSVFEQQVLRGMFPNVTALGNTNQERAIRIFTRRDLERAQLNAAEQWLTRHTDLTGFAEEWAQQEERLRQEAEARHRTRFGLPGARTGDMVGRAAQGASPPARTPQGRAPGRTRVDRNGNILP